MKVSISLMRCLYGARFSVLREEHLYGRDTFFLHSASIFESEAKVGIAADMAKRLDLVVFADIQPIYIQCHSECDFGFLWGSGRRWIVVIAEIDRLWWRTSVDVSRLFHAAVINRKQINAENRSIKGTRFNSALADFPPPGIEAPIESFS
jgi:hypothetical protein